MSWITFDPRVFGSQHASYIWNVLHQDLSAVIENIPISLKLN